MNAAHRRTLIALAACVALPAAAQTASPTSTTTTSTTSAAPSPGAAGERLASSFTAFAGSKENAASLVNGLRTGSQVTLAGPSAGGTSTGGQATTFTPPTKPMGYGNVRIALSLAQAQLASQGITQPTPQQLQTALMGSPAVPGGGTTTTGILQMRADGMGWGKIANTMGFKLGAVMSGRAAAAPTSGITSAAGAATSAGTKAKAASGVTTAAGGSAGAPGQGRGSGIVTAAGGATPPGLARGHAGSAASGVVSAQGAAHGAGMGGGGGQGRGKH